MPNNALKINSSGDLWAVAEAKQISPWLEVVHNFQRLEKHREPSDPRANCLVEKLFLNCSAAIYAAANEWSVVEPSSELGKLSKMIFSKEAVNQEGQK